VNDVSATWSFDGIFVPHFMIVSKKKVEPDDVEEESHDGQRRRRSERGKNQIGARAERNGRTIMSDKEISMLSVNVAMCKPEFNEDETLEEWEKTKMLLRR
jgi:hypothetical protein